MNKQFVRDWAEQRGVSSRIRHLAYDWSQYYSDLLLNTDDSRSLVREAKNILKECIEKEEDRGRRRTLKYELRFVRYFWDQFNACDCCDCSGCSLNNLEGDSIE